MASTDTTVTGPCLVGRHDRCAGILRSLLDEANGQPCECPTGCHDDQNPDQGDEEEAALEVLADLATGVGLAIRTARRWNVPVEPGVSEGRTALVRWVALIDDLLPKGGE